MISSTPRLSCPRCRHENDPTTPLCGNCYADLRVQTCPHCQIKNLSGATACARCRRALSPAVGSTATATPSLAAPRSSGADLGFAVLIVLYALVTGVLCCLAFSPGASALVVKLFACFGALLGPVLVSSLLWFGWASRHIPSRAFLLALTCGATVGVGAALLLHLVVPSVGLAFGAILAVPVIVGASEELGKVLSLHILFKSKHFPSELHGLIFGMLAGLGFAALENVFYVFKFYEQTGLRELGPVIAIRCATCLAHAVWSGCLASALWRERRVTLQFTRPLLNRFLVVALLHAVWDFGLVSRSQTENWAGVVASALCSAAIFAVQARAALSEGFGTT